MKTAKHMREKAEQCVRLARQTIEGSVASALLAYAGVLEQRARLIERGRVNDALASISPARVPARPGAS